MIVAPGSTSRSIDVQVVDDAGLAVTGLAAATFPAVTYSLAGANADSAVSLSDLATLTTAWTAGGLKERGGGVYRLDLPDAAFAAAGEVTVRGEAAGRHVLAAKVAVVGIPDAAPGGNNGLLVLGANSMTGQGMTVTSDTAAALQLSGGWDGAVGYPGFYLVGGRGRAGLRVEAGGSVPAGPVAAVELAAARQGAIFQLSSSSGLIGGTLFADATGLMSLTSDGMLRANSFAAGAVDAHALDASAAAAVADGLLGRSIAGGADGGRTVGEALAAARNRVAFDVPAAGQFTVYAADDATPLWTGTYSRGANTLGPLTGVDPA